MPTSIQMADDYVPKVRYLETSPHSIIQQILCKNDMEYSNLLFQFMKYLDWFKRISIKDESEMSVEPCWVNGWLPALDAISIYCLLAENNPSVYLEVGSGNSTKFAHRAIRDFKLRTKIISIDPAPRIEIDSICDEVIRTPFEEINSSVYLNVDSNTIIFIDSSHRSFQNSDVTNIFLEIIPSLPSGSIIGIHDIFLPYDYPHEWIIEKRFYNEQYLLAAFLLGGHQNYSILFPSYYVYHNCKTAVNMYKKLMFDTDLKTVELHGGGFWMKKS